MPAFSADVMSTFGSATSKPRDIVLTGARLGHDGGAEHVLPRRQLADREHVRKDHALGAGGPAGHLGGQERRRFDVGGDFVFRLQLVGAGAVRFDVSVHAAKRDGVSDGRLIELPHDGRTAHHQLAQLHRRRLDERRVNLVLDGPDAIAFDDRQLQRVLAGRDAGADVVLERRRHAVHHRRQPRVAGEALDDAAVAIADDVAERDHFRRRVVGADGGVDEELNLRGIGTSQREGRHLQRQRRHEQRRCEGRHRRLARVSSAILIGGRDELPPRSDGRARSIDRHADRVRFAVLVGDRRFDAEQVVAGQLGLDPGEGGVRVHGNVEERAAGRARQRLDALRPFETVGKRRRRGAGLRHVEHLIVELQGIDARARLDRQLPDLDHRRLLIVHHEAFGDDHHRLRQIDGLQREQQRAEVADRLLAFGDAAVGHRLRRRFGARPAQLLFEGHRAVRARARRTRAPAPAPGRSRRPCGWPSPRRWRC